MNTQHLGPKPPIAVAGAHSHPVPFVWHDHLVEGQRDWKDIEQNCQCARVDGDLANPDPPSFPSSFPLLVASLVALPPHQQPYQALQSLVDRWRVFFHRFEL
jgi:hypothetical protein